MSETELKERAIEAFTFVGGEDWFEDMMLGAFAFAIFLAIVIALLTVYLAFKTKE